MLNRFSLLRLPSVLALTIALTGIVEGPFSASLLARSTPSEQGALHGNAGVAGQTTVKKRKSTKKSSRKRSGRHTSRHYTLRGNPEVTRRVATQVIVETLPDLAQLIGLEVPAASLAESTSAPTASENVAMVETVPTKTVEVPTAGTSTLSAAKTATKGLPQASFSPTSGSTSIGTPAAAARTTGAPASGLPTTGAAAATSTSISPDYSDSELSDEEDPDKLTEEDEEMLAEEDDLTIDDFYDEFTDYMASLNGESDTYVTDNGIDKTLAMETLVDWLGTRYLFGGTSRSGIDCSAFTRTMYGSLGCPLPRTAASQWDAGDEVSTDNLQFGDLVFFHTREAVYVSHVGMYLGNNMFAHASSRNGVTVSSLESNYYSTHLIGARRFDVAAAKAEAEMAAVAAHGADTDTSKVQ